MERELKFPKTIYVKRDRDGDDSYLVSYEKAVEIAEMGEKVRVGVYNLVEEREIEGVVQEKKVGGGRR